MIEIIKILHSTLLGLGLLMTGIVWMMFLLTVELWVRLKHVCTNIIERGSNIWSLAFSHYSHLIYRMAFSKFSIIFYLGL